jgi:LysR family transcriptional regulator, carnitine catabolism transcriptional activator
MIDFTSRQLRAFLLVAEHGSFSRAAGALFITPAGLSILIREFETQLGTRLFDRTTRRVRLTRAGAELLAVARQNLRELDQTMSRVGRAEPVVSLSIGAPPLVAATVLAEAIKEFRSHGSSLRFRVCDTDSATTIEMVESGAVDIGVGVFFKQLAGIQRTLLFRFPLVVIRAGSAKGSHHATIAWSALKGEKLISLSPSLPFQRFIDKHLAKAEVKYQPGLEVNYLNTQIAMVEAGEGTAIIPWYGLLACQNRRIAASRLVSPVALVDFHEIRAGGRNFPPAGEEFTSFLQSYIAKWAGNLLGRSGRRVSRAGVARQ